MPKVSGQHTGTLPVFRQVCCLLLEAVWGRSSTSYFGIERTAPKDC
jgi:hypothetical protein